MKVELDTMMVKHTAELKVLIKARLWEAGCGGRYNPDEMLNECYMYLHDCIEPHMIGLDYLKMAKRWITNQSGWQASPGQPKENHKNFKTKHKSIGFDISHENKNFIYEDDFEDNLDFAIWVEKKLDRPEKTLFNLYYIEGQSHRKIADLIRNNGIKISDTSIYLELRKLKKKLKKLALIWSGI